MTRAVISVDYECPHCGCGYTEGDDALYADDIEDGNDQQCDECGNWFQLRCVSVDAEMECTKSVLKHEERNDG